MVRFAADTFRAAAGKQVQSCVRQLYSLHERLFSQISALAATSNVPVFKVSGKTEEGFDEVAKWFTEKAKEIKVTHHHHE